MEVSAGKSKITASIPAVAHVAESLVKKKKASALRHGKGEIAKMLGVGTNGGVSRVIKTQNTRLKAL